MATSGILLAKPGKVNCERNIPDHFMGKIMQDIVYNQDSLHRSPLLVILFVVLGRIMIKSQKAIKYAGQALVVFNGVIWMIVGIAALFRSDQVDSVLSWLYQLMIIGILGYGLLLIIAGVGLGRHKIFYLSALILSILSAVLTIFDDFGWVDLIAMLFFALTAVFLIIYRKPYLSPEPIPHRSE